MGQSTPVFSAAYAPATGLGGKLAKMLLLWLSLMALKTAFTVGGESIRSEATPTIGAYSRPIDSRAILYPAGRSAGLDATFVSASRIG